MTMQRLSSVGSTASPPLITIRDANRDPTTNNDTEQLPIKRTVSDIERSCSNERRNRQLGLDTVDSSSDLLEFLAAGDAAVGSGEFVRSGSLRGRRRSRRTTSDGLNDSRERVTPQSSSSTIPVTADGDDLPPSLSRSGPGRWSLRERVATKGTSSPPLSGSARWAKNMAARGAQDVESPSLRHSFVGRSISDHTDTETDSLLDRADNSLERRRQARLRQQSVSPVTTTSELDDRQPKPPLAAYLSRWSPPTIAEVSESLTSSGSCLRRNQLIDEATSCRRWSACDVDRAIHEVEKTGKQIDVVVSGAAGSANTQENGYQIASETGQVVTPDRLRGRFEDNETRRWGRIFDNDDEEGSVYLHRSATLPRRWRPENPERKTPNRDDRMEEIAESLPGQQSGPGSPASPGADRHPVDSNSPTQIGTTVESNSSSNLDGAQVRALPSRHTLAESVPSTGTSIAFVTRQLEQRTQSDSPLTTTDEAAETSRPTSAEFDNVSTSSSSRDEGFESAVDNGGPSARSSAWSYPDFDVPLSGDKPTSSPQELIGDRQTTMSEATTPCDGDDSVSAGTSFFARSIDSLILPHQELVITGETIDVDHFDADSSAHNNTNSREAGSTVPVAAVHPSSGSKQKSGSSKSSIIANLTARLSRPRKSAASVPQTGSSTGKLNGAGAKQPRTSSAALTRTAGAPSGTTADAGAKSSAFVRGSILRATMPASLHTGRTKKSTTSTAVSRDSLPPEPPQRTTSIRDSIQTAPRPGSVASRQPKSVASSSGTRKPQGEVTTKADKQIAPKTAELPARGRVAAQVQSKDRDKPRSSGPEVRGGRDKLVLYKVVDKSTKSSAATTSNTNTTNTSTAISGSRKQAVNGNGQAHRTQRLTSFNAPQQSRTFRF